MKYFLLFCLLLFLSFKLSKAQTYVCYYSANCSTEGRPPYTLAESVHDCCSKPDIVSVQNISQLSDVCFDCGSPMSMRITPRIVALYPPQPLILEIAVTGYTRVSWLVNGTVMHDFSRISLDRNDMKFTLNDTIMSDVGVYEADVHMIDGTIEIIDFIVQTFVSPSINMTSPTEADINSNGHVTVTCTSQANPTPTVLLSCDEGLNTTILPDVIIEGSFGVNLTSVTSSLQVASNNADGLKKCYCTVSAYDGSQNVMKNDFINLLSTPPTLMVSPLSTSIKVPQILELSCSGHGRPLPNITWSKNGIILTTNDRTNISEIDNNYTKTSLLTIYQSTRTDHGVYECTAINNYGNLTKNDITVNVQFPPVVTADDSPVEINTNIINEITLNCKAESNPLAIVFWVSGGGDTILNERCTTPIQWPEYLEPNNAEASIDYDSYTFGLFESSGSGSQQISSTGSPRNCSIDFTQDGSAEPFPLTQSTLTIHQLQYEESRTLVCVGHNSELGVSSIDTVKLILDGSPYFSQAPVSVPSLYVGSTAVYTCAVISQTPVYVTWLFNGILADPDQIDSINITEISNDKVTTSVLTINDVQLTDAGTYTCQAQNNNGTSSHNIIQNIYNLKPSLSIDNAFPSEGSDVQMICRAEGDPLPNITWTFTSQITGITQTLTPLNSELLLTELDDFEITSELNITDISRTNAGTYTCTTSIGQSSQVIVKVLVPVNITNPKQGEVFSLILGDSDPNISCQATGISAPVVNISRQDGLPVNIITQTSTLLDSGLYLSETKLDIDTISDSIGGDYTCLASNELGSVSRAFEINTRDNTIIHTISSGELTYTSGQDITLTCNISSYDSNSIITWYHSGEVLTETNRLSITTTNTTTNESQTLFGSVLSIKQLEVEDDGQYTCQVTNRYGTRMQMIGDVNVLVPPTVMVSPSEVYYVQGSDVVLTITCTGQGVPLPDVHFDGITCTPLQGEAEAEEILEGNTFIGTCDSTADDVSVILIIDNTTMHGSSVIQCTAVNRAGNISTSTILHMTGPPVIITPPSNTAATHGSTVTLSCIATGYPLPTIQWAHDNINSSIKDNSSVVNEQFGNGIRSNLTITNYHENSDEGLYYCIADNDYHQMVYSSASISTESIPPVIITQLTTDTLPISSSINITCQASGRPAPNITWERENGIIYQGDDTWITVTDGPLLVSTSVLVLDELELSSEGNYVCIANSSDSSVEKVVKRISVSVPPTVSISPSSVVHTLPGSSDVTLTCTGTGKPSPLVTFGGHQCSYEDNGNGSNTIVSNGIIIRCGNSNISEDGIYTVSVEYILTNDVNEFNVRNITCSARNYLTTVGATATINPQVLKTVTIHTAPMTLSEGNTLILQCTATGYPIPTLNWLYGDDNGAIVFSDRHSKSNDMLINSYSVISRLTVTDLIPADAGEYKCKAQYNSVHLVDSTQLIVTAIDDCNPNPCVNGTCIDELKNYVCSCNDNYIGRNCSEKVPSIVSPTVTQDPANITQVYLLGSFNLTCEATGTGPMYLWKKDGETTDEVSDELIITQAQPDDRGYYTCIAVNTAGNSTSRPGLVVIPGLYQYAVAFERIDPQDDTEITNITIDMGECLGYDVLPDQNTTIVYSVGACNSEACTISGGFGSVVVSVFQRSPPFTSDGLRDALWNKLQSLQTECRLGIRVTDVWRFDGCRTTDTILHKEYNITITWPESDIGSGIVERCPCGTLTQSEYTNEISTRQCGGTFTNGGMWLEPDTSQCIYNSKDINITLTLCHLTTVTDIQERARSLAQISGEATNFEEIDYTIAVLVLDGLSRSQEIINSQELQNEFTKTISNLLLVDSFVAKSSQARHRSIDKLLQSLELFEERIAIPSESRTKSQDRNNQMMKSISYRHDKFGVIVTELNTTHFSNQTFTTQIRGGNTLTGLSLEQGSEVGEQEGIEASIFIPESLISKCPPNTIVRISYNAFMTPVFFQADPASTFGRLIVDGNLSVSQMILSASACKGSLVEGLEDPVIIEFPKPSYLQSNDRNTSDSVCVFWDNDIRNGSWSMRGCVNISSPNDDVIRCRCNHLTHFGYLLDVMPAEGGTGGVAERTLEIITYIGAIISALCLILTIITFLASKALLERTQGKTLINMGLALIGMYIVYLAAANAESIRSYSGGNVFCAFLGALLYYFMLVYFMWTAIEAIDLYRKLVVVFYNKTPYFIIIGAIVAWTVPLIITGISVGAGHDYYLQYEFFCRPIGLPFYIGFLVPFAIIYIFDWIIFIIIMVKLISKRQKNKPGTVERSSFTLTHKQLFVMAMILSVNFGLGWIFGLLATGQFPREAYLTFIYLFSIFVGMQGVLIFIIHCLRAKAARDLWRLWFTVIFCCRKPKDVKHATAATSHIHMTTPGLKRNKLVKETTLINESYSKEKIHDSDEDVRNPIYGMSEAETDITFLKLPSSDLGHEEFDIEMMTPLQQVPPPVPEIETSATETKKNKKTSRKETKTRKKTSITQESKQKKLSKQESKKKISKKVSKKKLADEQDLRPLQLQELGGGSAYSLGEMSLTGSQVLEIDFAPSVHGKSDEEEEEETWEKLQKQFDNIHALVNESFVKEAEATFTLKLEETPTAESVAVKTENTKEIQQDNATSGKEEVIIEMEEQVAVMEIQNEDNEEDEEEEEVESERGEQREENEESDKGEEEIEGQEEGREEEEIGEEEIQEEGEREGQEEERGGEEESGGEEEIQEEDDEGEEREEGNEEIEQREEIVTINSTIQNITNEIENFTTSLEATVEETHITEEIITKEVEIEEVIIEKIITEEIVEEIVESDIEEEAIDG